MKCPNCGSMNTHVIDSRFSKSTNATRRRRLCHDCNHRFTSYEVIDLKKFKQDLREEIINKVSVSLDFRTVVQEGINKAFENII